MRSNLLFVSEALKDNPVEGGDVLAQQLADHLVERHGAEVYRPLSLSGPLRRLSRMVLLMPYWKWTPAVRQVVYFPDSGLTRAALVRCFVLWLLLGRPNLDVVVVAEHYFAAPGLSRFIPASWSFVSTHAGQLHTLRSKGVDVREIGPRVDPRRIASEQLSQDAARDELDILDGPIFLHVGHPTIGRNLTALAPLADAGQLLLLLSPFRTIEDGALPPGDNVHVVHRRVSNVGSFYRAADVYVFPTYGLLDVIGLPMSILEALANRTPVIARRSQVTSRWENTPGVTLVDSDEELIKTALGYSTLLSPPPQPTYDDCMSDMTPCRATAIPSDPKPSHTNSIITST